MPGRLSVYILVLIALHGSLLMQAARAAGTGEREAPIVTEPAVETPAPAEKLGSSWSGSSDLIGTVNPLGVELSTTVDYQKSYRYSRQYDMVSGYWKAGGELEATPAYLQPSVHIEWMPWIATVINVEYDAYYFYGANEGLLSFASAGQPFGDDVRRARSGTEESGWGERVLIQPTLQGKIGPLLIRNQTDYAWYRFPGRGPYFLELEYDTLLKSGDHLFANRTQLLEEIGRSGKRSTLLGPYFEIVHADDGNLTSRRAGVLFYSEQGPQLAQLKTTHYFAQLGYYLSDPNREHTVYLIIGIGGDFAIGR